MTMSTNPRLCELGGLQHNETQERDLETTRRCQRLTTIRERIFIPARQQLQTD